MVYLLLEGQGQGVIGVKATTIGVARDARGGVGVFGLYDQDQEPMWEWDRENDEPIQEIAGIDNEAPDNRVADAQAEDPSGRCPERYSDAHRCPSLQASARR